MHKVIFVKSYKPTHYAFLSGGQKPLLPEHLMQDVPEWTKEIAESKLIKSLTPATDVCVSCGVDTLGTPIDTFFGPAIKSNYYGAIRADFLDPYNDCKTISWFEIFANGATKEHATANLVRNIKVLPEYEYLLHSYNNGGQFDGQYTYFLYNPEILQHRLLQQKVLTQQPYYERCHVSPIGYLTTKFNYGHKQK